MKKLLILGLVIFLSSIFFSCLSTSESVAANETEVLDSSVQASSEEVLDSITEDSSLVEEISEEELTLDEKAKVAKETYPTGEIPVQSTDLTTEETQRLFGKGKSPNVSVEGSLDKDLNNIAPKKSSVNTSSGQVFSPKDTHLKVTGSDSMSVKGSLGSDATEESTVAEKTPTATEESIVAEKTPTATEESTVAEKTPAATEESTVAEKTPAATEETTVAEKTPTATEESTVAEKTPTATDESTVAEKTPTATEETTVAEKTPTATEETTVAEKTPTATEESTVAEKTPPATEEDDAVASVSPELPISRSVTIDKRQYLDIVYPGTGWIYMGEVPSTTELLTYFGRKLTDSDTAFTLKSVSPGTTILHFYKQDILSASFIDDYIEVTITDEVAKPGSRVLAPAYSEIVPAYQYEIPNPEEFVVEEEVEVQEEVLLEQEKTEELDTEPNDTSIKSQETIRGEEPSSAQKAAEVEIKPVQEFPVSTPIVQEEEIQKAPIISYVEGSEPTGTVIQDATQEQNVSSGQDNSLYNQANELTDTSMPSIPLEHDKDSFKTEIYETETNGAALSLLEQAQAAYDNKEYKKAADLLDEFFLVADSKIDEALYLKGQVYEAKSEVQNIRVALSAYKELVTQFPQSSYWQLAKNREIYLNRFYFDIR